MKKLKKYLTCKWLLCFINFQFFEIEIPHRRIYKSNIVMILEVGMFLPSYLVLDISSNKICKVLQSKHFQPSHITKKRVDLLDLLILSPFSENKANFEVHTYIICELIPPLR